MVSGKGARERIRIKNAPAYLLFLMSVLAVVATSLTRSQAAPSYGIGIGIRKDGPLRASVGDVIQYTVVIYNTGSAWIRNITIKDVFPNGTTAAWLAPDLSPATQTGDSFNISRILYMIRSVDVSPESPPHIINHAEVTGYADVEGLGLLVYAETNFPTFILVPTVGGYTVTMSTTNLTAPVVIYVISLVGMTAFFGTLRRRTVMKSLIFGRYKKHRNPHE